MESDGPETSESSGVRPMAALRRSLHDILSNMAKTPPKESEDSEATPSVQGEATEVSDYGETTTVMQSTDTTSDFTHMLGQNNLPETTSLGPQPEVVQQLQPHPQNPIGQIGNPYSIPNPEPSHRMTGTTQGNIGSEQTRPFSTSGNESAWESPYAQSGWDSDKPRHPRDRRVRVPRRKTFVPKGSKFHPYFFAPGPDPQTAFVPCFTTGEDPQNIYPLNNCPPGYTVIPDAEEDQEAHKTLSEKSFFRQHLGKMFHNLNLFSSKKRQSDEEEHRTTTCIGNLRSEGPLGENPAMRVFALPQVVYEPPLMDGEPVRVWRLAGAGGPDDFHPRTQQSYYRDPYIVSQQPQMRSVRFNDRYSSGIPSNVQNQGIHAAYTFQPAYNPASYTQPPPNNPYQPSYSQPQDQPVWNRSQSQNWDAHRGSSFQSFQTLAPNPDSGTEMSKPQNSASHCDACPLMSGGSGGGEETDATDFTDKSKATVKYRNLDSFRYPAQDKVEVYYFDHGNSGYLRTTDHRPPMITENYIEKIDFFITKFWAELFGSLHIGFAFFICFLLQFYRFILYTLLRPLLVGVIQLTADYLFKPVLSIVFNGILQPIFILLFNIATSFRDFCEPVAQTIGFFLREIAMIIGSFRLVEKNEVVYRHLCETCGKGQPQGNGRSQQNMEQEFPMKAEPNVVQTKGATSQERRLEEEKRKCRCHYENK